MKPAVEILMMSVIATDQQFPLHRFMSAKLCISDKDSGSN